ncbi:YoaK family protein [Flavobacterium flavigenum]|uniref:YoaK family protein n=1 Tax=Flavobacterium flavigenum TaxID=3003258 RepID=UPI00248213DA|nr:YoaK family protein [Flavobacterium flavigenum]
MFKHKGKARTLKHNLRIASLLSFVAGIVNVGGFLAVQRLTTNVTGHFAFFVDEIFKLNFWQAFVYFLYIFFFFLGSFSSNLLVEITSKTSDRLIYVIPTIIESAILFFLALSGQFLISQTPNLLACSLLFAMGLQNSLVTTISNSTVRTTHLTGLFTDLGIELSQLFFYKNKDQKDKLYSSIKLRLTIIAFFFLGGLLSGIFYSALQLYVLAIAATVLIIGIIYDDLKLKLIRYNRSQNEKGKKDT